MIPRQGLYLSQAARLPSWFVSTRRRTSVQNSKSVCSAASPNATVFKRRQQPNAKQPKWTASSTDCYVDSTRRVGRSSRNGVDQSPHSLGSDELRKNSSCKNREIRAVFR